MEESTCFTGNQSWLYHPGAQWWLTGQKPKNEPLGWIVWQVPAKWSVPEVLNTSWITEGKNGLCVHSGPPAPAAEHLPSLPVRAGGGTAPRASLCAPLSPLGVSVTPRPSNPSWLWTPWVRVFCNGKVEPHVEFGVFPPETRRVMKRHVGKPGKAGPILT